MSDPRLAGMYEDVDSLAKTLREVAEAHIKLTPPDDKIDFILIVASDEGHTGMHTYRNADGSGNVEAAIATLRRVAAKWLADGAGYELGDRDLTDAMREEFDV
jgi:hypothetical protein